MSEFEGWESWVEPAFVVLEPGNPRYKKNSYMTWNEKDKPKFTPEEEFAKITKDIEDSDGFDIDFSFFRCIFNYHPAELDEIEDYDDNEPITTGDLLKRLAQKSLADRNEKHGTEFEFVKIVRANYHFAAAMMYLITFQVKDPYDGKIKNFRARVLHADNIVTKYIFCEPEPNQGVECVGKKLVKIEVEEDVTDVSKKQRLE